MTGTGGEGGVGEGGGVEVSFPCDSFAATDSFYCMTGTGGEGGVGEGGGVEVSFPCD
jgi:hypothetical protein